MTLFLPEDVLLRAVCCLSHSWCEAGQGPPSPAQTASPLAWLPYRVGPHLAFLAGSLLMESPLPPGGLGKMPGQSKILCGTLLPSQAAPDVVCG